TDFAISTWRRCEWQRSFLSPTQLALCPDVLSEAAARAWFGIEVWASSHYWHLNFSSSYHLRGRWSAAVSWEQAPRLPAMAWNLVLAGFWVLCLPSFTP